MFGRYRMEQVTKEWWDGKRLNRRPRWITRLLDWWRGEDGPWCCWEHWCECGWYGISCYPQAAKKLQCVCGRWHVPPKLSIWVKEGKDT